MERTEGDGGNGVAVGRDLFQCTSTQNSHEDRRGQMLMEWTQLDQVFLIFWKTRAKRKHGNEQKVEEKSGWY